MKKLTPTSYALLGLLDRKPWSAYELNTHMQTSVLRAFWPRAASHVYSEPKKLVDLKLVSASQAQRNGRGRTVYTILPEGRRALKEWLGAPTESYFTMSHEAMLKFLYAASASREVLEENLDAIEKSMVDEARAVLEGVKLMTEELETIEGLPYNGMALKFLADVLEAQVNWAREVRTDLASLKGTGGSKDSKQVGLKSYQQLIEHLERLVEE